MKKFFTTQKIAELGILIAITICIQLFSNNVPTIFGVTINLAIIPICVAACTCGPLGGLFVGLVDGLIVIFAPSTLSIFMPVSPIGTIILCLSKSGLAGLVAGFIFKLFEKKLPKLGSIISACSVPIVNTGMFVGACFIIYVPIVNDLASQAGQTVGQFVLFAFVGINFLIEFGVCAIFSPLVYIIYSVFKSKREQTKIS